MRTVREALDRARGALRAYQDLRRDRQPNPGWTSEEQAAYDAPGPWPHDPAPVFVNSTDAWTASGGYRMEPADGPPCPDLIHLLGDRLIGLPTAGS
ncbi:hypothetical protein [Streptomyces sp. NPDC047315]|uniref:hypothetical protein n=1 Tax=Streptomyces sp. NPDC047315 TaxID=3155142 RepID=UPI0033E3645E